MKKYLFFVTVLFTSCIYDPAPDIITVINKSNENILLDWNNKPQPQYPALNSVEIYCEDYFCGVNDTLYATENGKWGWVNLIASSQDKKVYFFIFNADSVKQYNSIDHLILKNMYKRVEYSLEQLEASNWTIEIPDIKRSPAE
jgi:hypothetical protein